MGADGHVVEAAEAQEARLAADLVDDVLLCDLMLALQKTEAHVVQIEAADKQAALKLLRCSICCTCCTVSAMRRGTRGSWWRLVSCS